MNCLASAVLVVDDGSVSVEALTALLKTQRRAVGKAAYVLSFREFLSEENKAQIRHELDSEIEFLNGATEINRVAPMVRAELTAFVAEFPRRPIRSELTFFDLFRDRDLPLWWYAELSQKNGPRARVYWELFRLRAVVTTLEKLRVATCVAVCNAGLTDLLQQACPSRGVRVIAPLGSRSRGCSLAGILFKVTLQWLRAFASVLFAPSGSSEVREPGRFTLAFTWYPRVWTERDGTWQDMYYGANLSTLACERNTRSVYVLRMNDDISAVLPTVFWTRLKALKEARRQPPEPWLFLETFGSVALVFRHFLDPRYLLRYWLLDRQPGYSELFQMGDCNVYELFREIMWRSVAVYWPHMILLSRAVERLGQRVRAGSAIFYSFEYIHGRAISAGLRRAGIPFQVGLQHGPITRNKLVYLHDSREYAPFQHHPGLPRPDEFWVDGESARSIMEENAIAPSQIRVVGASRFSSVFTRASQAIRPVRAGADRRRILLAPGLHETEAAVRFALNAFHALPDIDLIIKLHPKYDPKRMSNLVGLAGSHVTVLQDMDIYSLFSEVDLVVSDYSSVSVEAFFFDIPVILLILGSVPDKSPFADEEGAFLKAYSPLMLKTYAERVLEDVEFRQDYVRRARREAEHVFGRVEDAET